jgi:NADPH2:quinone reductase
MFTSRAIESMVTRGGLLRLGITSTEVPAPGPGTVVVRVDAAPINPSDLGLLFGPADIRTARSVGTAADPCVEADVPADLLRLAAARLDRPMPVGNEGAGGVVAVGEGAEAKALEGRTVGIVGGGMYAQYRAMPAALCLSLHEGTTAAQGASCFVNPLTSLGMVETMRREGHRALVHTAAASNLGQMLNRLCQADGVELVNIVRRPEQVQLLREQGARHVCDSSSENFREELIDALAQTGATIAFDATGGGELAGQVLSCMEAAAARSMQGFDPYGSGVHKQVYIYGGLDRSATVLRRDYGMAWGIGGWLLTPFLQQIGGDAMRSLMERVAAEIHTVFASNYAKTISLTEALEPETMQAYGRLATGEKYLILPNA